MKLFLIDAYALIYRSYYAFIKNPRINSKGMNTGAILGFMNTLQEILTKEKPTHLGVAFDHGKTFRNDAFPAYKAQRAETPEDVKAAVPVIKDLLSALHIPYYQVDGFEADDVVGTLALMAGAQGITTYMLTPDKDYGQLVRDNVFIFRPRHGGGYETLDEQAVCEKFDIESTSQVIDLLALMGDAADNFPGCPGVGPKTASQLIREFGSIDNLLANSSQLKGKLREKVESAVDDIRMSQFLATIRTDVPVTLNLDDLAIKDPDEERLRQLFDELEFRSLAARFIKSGAGATTSKNASVNANKQSASKYKKDVNANALMLDLFAHEGTDDCEYRKHEAVQEPLFAYKVTDNEGDKTKIFLSPESLGKIEEIRHLLLDEAVLKVGYDLKTIIKQLRAKGIELRGELFDTMIAEYLLNPGAPTLFSSAATPEDYERLRAQLEEMNLHELFYEIEMPLVYVLAEMELEGVRIDIEALRETSVAFTSRMREIEQEVHALAGMPFNVSSPKQVGEILFDKLQIVAKPKKTKTGQYVTNEEELQKLSDAHPIVQRILDYRGLKKLISTYLDALPTLVNASTGKIHTTFNQAVTATGRLSSSEPNLQNIPVRGEDGKEIRKCFVPEPGCLFFSADYSQIELRVMAHLSGDEQMIHAFRNGLDVHASTAAKVYKKDISEITREERTKAKRANFGIIYGITTWGLASRLRIDRKEAKQLIDGYFQTFPQVEQYMEKAKELARNKGYAETLFHRRRYLPDINSTNSTVRGFAERNAISAPIQGSAADIIKKAMVAIYHRFKEEGLQSKMILQVHDELNFSVLPEEKERVEQIVIEEMERAYPLIVPMTADWGWGNNWLEAH